MLLLLVLLSSLLITAKSVCGTLPGCDACADPAVCDACSLDYRFYSGDGVCYHCPNTMLCQDCSADDNCFLCNTHTSRNYNSMLSVYECVSCSVTSCAHCDVTDNCTQCNSLHSLNYDSFGATYVCTSCNIAYCDHCNTANTCTTCATGYQLANNQCFGCGLAKCSWCAGCLVGGGSCPGCSPTLYLYNSTCSSDCPTGTYKEASNCTCQDCADGCRECYGAGLEKCTSCTNSSSSDVYFKVPNRDICTTNCSNFYYGVEQYNLCEPCHISCKTCSLDPLNCSACRNVSGIVYYSDNSTCVVACPEGYYGKPSDNTCDFCADECKACYGPTTSECTKCKINDTSVRFYKLYGSDECVEECSAGTFPHNSTNTCKPCDSECKTCEGSSSNCTSCGRVNGVELFLENNTCVATCASGTYMNSTSDQCEQCHDGCLKCTGPTLKDCQKCNTSDAGDVVYYKYIGEDTCSTTCPKGQFIDSIIDYYCQACFFLC